MYQLQRLLISNRQYLTNLTDNSYNYTEHQKDRVIFNLASLNTKLYMYMN